MLSELQTSNFIINSTILFIMNTIRQVTKVEKILEDEAHKLNTELQIALLKWKINSMQKKTKFVF
jgi:hypothetical protein